MTARPNAAETIARDWANGNLTDARTRLARSPRSTIVDVIEILIDLYDCTPGAALAAARTLTERTTR